jgi:hypothetical protein
MLDCVLAGAVPDQAGRTGRARGIVVPMFKPDPGEMRSVWAAIRECACIRRQGSQWTTRNRSTV